MAVPKRRMSHSRKGHRRSHDALKPAQPGRCTRCHQAAMPHRICPNCGWYRGRRQVLGEEQG
ncbi:MAG: 50S ribosomal protein L32 [Planctomycetaceae bacterium]|nr:50S ribosomal protein L32 [Planctomycetota bacterium]NUN53328.1 50S ribosomal protein L32 [Planctomycetaceae bacterium]